MPVELSFGRLAVGSLWVDGFMLRDSHLELGRKPERGVFARQDAGWRGGVDARSRSCTAWLWCIIYHGTSFSLLFFFFLSNIYLDNMKSPTLLYTTWP